MPVLLFVAFVVVPLLEIALIARIGGALGFLPTLVLLLGVSLAGAWLVRREGAAAWRRFREAVAGGRLPGAEVLDGALLLVGGALLLTPGFLTDMVGLALVVPLSRRPVNRWLRRRALAGTGFGWLAAVAGVSRRAHRDGPVVEVVDTRREDAPGPADAGPALRPLPADRPPTQEGP